MKCDNCDVVVEKIFSFAWKNNQCPACGKNIMAPERLASYINLQKLIKDNFSNVDAEKIANLVVANFELKQFFKESGVKKLKSIKTSLAENETIEVTEESEEELSNKEYDNAHKKNQTDNARRTLKKMKEDAYEGALKDQYGMGEIDDNGSESTENDFFNNDDDVKPIQAIDRMKQAQMQSTSKDNMLSGTGGFSRSDV